MKLNCFNVRRETSDRQHNGFVHFWLFSEINLSRVEVSPPFLRRRIRACQMFSVDAFRNYFAYLVRIVVSNSTRRGAYLFSHEGNLQKERVDEKEKMIRGRGGSLFISRSVNGFSRGSSI